MRSKLRYPLMRSQLVVATVRHVRAQGGDVARLITEFGLPDDVEVRTEVTLPLDGLRAFFESAARMLDDPLLGVHMARAMDRGAFGVLAFSSRSAPTVRESLERLARYIRLSNDTVEVSFEVTAAGGIIRQRVPGHPACLGRHANEFFVAILLEEGRRAFGDRAQPGRVWLAHEAPHDLTLASELGVPEVSFFAEENGLWFSPEVLALEVPGSDPALLSYLDAQAQKELIALAPEPGFLREVRRVVREQLDGGTVTLPRAAKLLGLSRRTLQRRLEEEGTSFQRLVDEAREQLARTLVAHDGLPLSRIASTLGYSDERPFLRAFRRWTGVTPSAYRAKRHTQ
jgi:AraC-like DNA-binding protein